MVRGARNLIIKGLDPPMIQRAQVARYLVMNYRPRYAMAVESIHFCDVPYSEVEKYLGLDKKTIDDIIAIEGF